MSNPSVPAPSAWARRVQILTAVYFAALVAATHWPLPPGAIPVGADKWYHVIAYAALAVLLLASCELRFGRLEPKHFFAVWLACTLYGVLDEATQIPVGRDGNVHDWAADAAGVVSGMAAYCVLRWFVSGGRPISPSARPH